MTVPPRPPARRRVDTERRLSQDVDLWVATTSEDQTPYLIPLSFHWDGQTLLLSTSRRTRTASNLQAGGSVRLALGPTRDVTLIDGDVTVLEIDELSPERADAFAAHAGFDPRAQGSAYCWFVVRPRRIQAWREADELDGRELMAGGRWLG